jgi:hypothetical protein
MTKRVKIDVSETDQPDKKVIDFFKSNDYQLIEIENSCLKFRKKPSLLDAWKTNPLKWGSEVSVLISGNTIEADFVVDTDAQMNTKEEKQVWQTFIEGFQNYLTNGETKNSKLDTILSENKNSRLVYFGWAIVGALTGGLLSFIYTKLTNNHSTLSLLLIPIMAMIFLSWRIRYVKAASPQC